MERFESVIEYVEEQKKAKSEGSVCVSDVNSDVWQTVESNARLAVTPFVGDIKASRMSDPPPFGWDDRLEKAQADRYMPYLNGILGWKGRQYQLVDAANNYPKMLTTRGSQLGVNFSGKP